jgi:uncharacterized small protein (DUF1192 family)
MNRPELPPHYFEGPHLNPWVAYADHLELDVTELTRVLAIANARIATLEAMDAEIFRLTDANVSQVAELIEQLAAGRSEIVKLKAALNKIALAHAGDYSTGPGHDIEIAEDMIRDAMDEDLT